MQRGAWQHVDLPAYASELRARIAFAWAAMDALYEEDERIVGHAADSYHRIDIRQTSRSLIVRHHDRVIASLGSLRVWFCASLVRSALLMSMSPRLPMWSTRPSARTRGCAATTTSVMRVWGAWSYREAYSEVSRISSLVSFEPEVVSVQIDGRQLKLEPGQTVIPHGPDRELTVDEARPRE